MEKTSVCILLIQELCPETSAGALVGGLPPQEVKFLHLPKTQAGLNVARPGETEPIAQGEPVRLNRRGVTGAK